MSNYAEIKRKIILLLILCLLGLSACNPATPMPTPTLTPLPTATFTPTSTSTPTPTPTSIRLGNYPLLSPEDMRYDLKELFHRLETTHPNPYAKRSKAEVDAERQKIYDELGQPMTMIEFFKKVAPLVASLGDYHTDVYLPDDITGLIEENELFFPLMVEFEEERGFITFNSSDNPDIPLGAEILSINGKTPSEILSELDGFSFWFGLWLLNGSISEYLVEILPPGGTTPVTKTIHALPFATVIQDNPPHQPESVVYTKIPDESVGLLAINSFTGIGPLLKPAFVQIQADGVQYLIIDVRNNPGGDSINSLMDYLTDQPYKIYSRYYQAPFQGYGSGEPREADGPVYQPFDTVELFKGDFYVLVGPNSFSAAIMFAAIVQDYHLGTVIGEETIDSAFCGGVQSGTLPRTKLLYTMVTSCFVRPSGSLDNRPVIPDIIVKTTVQDQLAGRDPVLDYALDLIHKGE